MNKALQEKLYGKYPDLFRQKDMSMQETCMCWGMECRSGWYDLIDELCSKLVEADPNAQAVQVKEKFGGLSFYIIGNEEAQDIVGKYEEKSHEVCEVCGKKGVMCARGSWLKTLCGEHALANDYKKCPECLECPE